MKEALALVAIGSMTSIAVGPVVDRAIAWLRTKLRRTCG